MRSKDKALEMELSEYKKQGTSIIRVLSRDFQQLADRSQDAIYQFDVESGTYSFFNKKFLSLYAVEEGGIRILSQEKAFQQIHPTDREKVKAAKAFSLQSSNSIGEIEYRLLRPDGSERMMHDRWSVVRDPSGQPIAVEGFIRDNTRRIQAEKKFEMSIRNSLIGCYIVQDGRFKYVNPEFIRITGYDENELIGTNPLDWVQKKYRREVKIKFIKMLKGERFFPYEYCFDDKNGNTKWILETATAIQYKGRRAALGYFMDISKAKEVEKERLAKEKLLSVLELAGAVGHELNNPLQIVSMCAEKLANISDNNELKPKLFLLLRNNIDRMKNIIIKFQNITQYATKEYVEGKSIIDIDAASNGG